MFAPLAELYIVFGVSFAIVTHLTHRDYHIMNASDGAGNT
ncbi:hypothetical protein PRUB_a5289 [Pseudoalteromonas rubra]|uniref:Uncharacterized protein n=1 Tax=Pseudoalteromonas rubra TaxID=43658 RepID=A0A8T0C3Y5_9GAMM|nr:hypothetical protein PRUB_a5289 [Pseudoalteromonas rubra]